VRQPEKSSFRRSKVGEQHTNLQTLIMNEGPVGGRSAHLPMARGAFPPIERGPYRSLEVKLLADGVDDAATNSQASSLFHPALLRARCWHLLAIVCCFSVV
jgi:hypothetical protein